MIFMYIYAQLPGPYSFERIATLQTTEVRILYSSILYLIYKTTLNKNKFHSLWC